MAAGPWTFYNKAKMYLMDGTIDLNSDVFKMALYTSASNAATSAVNITATTEITGEVAAANGYAAGGKTMAVTWGVGASASEYRFDATALIWTASGGNIPNVKFAVIHVSGGQALCYSQLSASQFTVTAGNTLTITPSSNGIFELN